MIRVALTIAAFLQIAAAAEPQLPPKEKFHLYLLVGQSNMAGRGTVEEQDKTPHPRVLMLTKAETWAPAVDPMHFDKPAAGVGLGKTFGRLVAEVTPEATIGLIPCAVGGSPIDSWTPGAFYPPTKSHPWDDMVRRVTAAMKVGTLKGILWHQGEADCKPELAPAYEAKLHDLVKRMRALVKDDKMPFIVGEIGQFKDVPPVPDSSPVIAAHKSLPGKVPATAFVSSEGLEHKGDKVHFDSASFRELGRRYFDAYQKLRAQ
jgi:hypothetical protein